jgi:hypothetical protein
LVNNPWYNPDSRNGGQAQMVLSIAITPTGNVRRPGRIVAAPTVRRPSEENIVDSVIDLEGVARNLEAIAERHGVMVPEA